MLLLLMILLHHPAAHCSALLQLTAQPQPCLQGTSPAAAAAALPLLLQLQHLRAAVQARSDCRWALSQHRQTLNPSLLYLTP
jgi:hypothetical protein